MADESLGPIISTVEGLADQIEGGIAAIKSRGAKAFQDGRIEDVAYELERLNWSLKAVESLRQIARDLPVLAVPTPTPVKAVVAAPAPPVVKVEAVKPSPAPVMAIQEPEPEPEPDLSELRASLTVLQKTWLKKTQAIMAYETWTNAQEAEAKALVAEGRGMVSRGAKIKGFAKRIEPQIEFLKEEFDRKARVTTFFAFNPNTQHLGEDWTDVAAAYHLFAVAISALDWLEAHPQLDAKDRKEVLQTAAAAEANLHRKLDRIGKGGLDEQQKYMHGEIERLVDKAFYVPYWNRGTEGGQGDAVVEAKAEEIEQLVEQFTAKREEMAKRQALSKVKAEQAALQEQKLAELAALIAQPETVEDFDPALVGIVDELMELGVPPSNRNLLNLILPFRGCLELSKDKRTLRALEYLAGEVAKIQRKGGQVVDAENDELSDEALNRVKAALTGKRILFLGGNKGQGWRQQEYKEKLGIKELVWPDFEEHTRPSSMANHVDHADVVCYLIRWSRHSYKGLLDRAKDRGKESLILVRGVGLNTFVQSYDEQVLRVS